MELSNREEATGVIKKVFKDDAGAKIYVLKNGKEIPAKRFWRMYYKRGVL